MGVEYWSRKCESLARCRKPRRSRVGGSPRREGVVLPETQDSTGERRLPLRRPLSNPMRWDHCEVSSLMVEFFEERKLVIGTLHSSRTRQCVGRGQLVSPEKRRKAVNPLPLGWDWMTGCVASERGLSSD